MCSIAGIISTVEHAEKQARLAKMNELMAYRGPDHSATFVEGQVGLAHNRLAIVDTSALANQPMISEQHDHALVYNGMLYNYKELRALLVEAGYQFKSNSDTEVVLHAFDFWREDCFSRFNGMFALACYNRKTGQLTLARDRYGMKPLYYCFGPNGFFFASEVKGLLDGSARVNRQALVEYFTFQNLFRAHTLFDGVYPVEPGQYLVYDGEKTKTFTYWNFDFFAEDATLTQKHCLEGIEYHMQTAVRRHLQADSEVGSFLSSGIDSTAIVALAVKEAGHLQTYTCGFDLSQVQGIELNFDESRPAREVARHLNTDHHEIILGPGHLEEAMPSLIWHLEDLRMGQCYPNYYIAGLAADNIKVVMGGTGSDELFAGYPWRYMRGQSFRSQSAFVTAYFSKWQRLFSLEEWPDFFRGFKASHLTEQMQSVLGGVFTDHRSALNNEDCTRMSLYFEAKTFLPGLLLVDDRLTMAHGLELRLPFLDNELVDFALQIPLRYKLKNLNQGPEQNENIVGNKVESYFQRTRDGKAILRAGLRRLVSEEVAQRPKQGFSAPDGSWYAGKSLDYIRKMLLRSDTRLYEYFNRSDVEGLVAEHLQGRANRRLLIWSLLSFEVWLRTFVK